MTESPFWGFRRARRLLHHRAKLREILIPPIGSGSVPFAPEAKAIAGASRPGITERRQTSASRRSEVFATLACAAAAARADVAMSCSRREIEVCSSCPPAGPTGRTVRAPLRAPFRFPAAYAGAPARARSFAFFPAKVRRDHDRGISFGGYFGPYSYQLGKVGDERIDLHLHVGKHGAQQNGSAHGLQRIFRASPAARGAAGAPSLQGCKHLGDSALPALERAADGVLVAAQPC